MLKKMCRNILVGICGDEIGAQMYETWDWGTFLVMLFSAIMYYISVVLFCA